MNKESFFLEANWSDKRMKTFEQRARELADGMSTMARAVVPTGLITLLIDICKTLDQLTKEKS